MDLEAYVLIGGRSSRLGQDKALIKLSGITLAERAAHTISTALSPKQLYLVAADEAQFAAGDLPENIPVIFDRHKGRGAYGGLHAALSKAETEWVFVLACDYPFVSAELLKYVAGFVAEEFDAIAPLQPDGRLQPLCAFYRTAACLKAVEEIMRKSEKPPPLRAVFEKVRTRFVAFDELKHLAGAENFFLNLNTAENLKRLLNFNF
jgi:molybdopterin-guanine dinucleotide biosynthesis protein A